MSFGTSLHSPDSEQHSQETIIGAIRNAAQIAQLWSMPETSTNARARSVFADIARLLSGALGGLSEPNLAAMQAGAILLAEWQGTPEPQRQLRDTIAGILHAQVSGVVPKTWEVS